MKFKDYLETIATFLFTAFCYSLYKGVLFPIYGPINDFLNQEVLKEILLTIILPTISVLCLKLYLFSKRMKNLAETIQSVNSDKLKYSCKKEVETSAENITNKFSALLSNNVTNNILWELESMELTELETECINCSISCTKDFSIKEKILNHRRIRITSIAKSLIHSKCEYLTTETRKPSEIIKTDEQYYKNLQNLYSLYKPDIACRLLIMKKEDFIKELADNKSILEDFINLNNFDYPKSHHSKLKFIAKNNQKENDKKKNNRQSKLKFIVWTNTIDDIFKNYKLNQFYDFAISKKKNKTTIFAQKAAVFNQNCITSFDSDYAGNISTVERYITCYNDLIKMSSKIDSNTQKYTGNVIFSDFIKDIQDAEKFINDLN